MSLYHLEFVSPSMFAYSITHIWVACNILIFELFSPFCGVSELREITGLSERERERDRSCEEVWERARYYAFLSGPGHGPFCNFDLCLILSH